ncbi:unnamed protein product [Lactuca virosa]|uniref:Uncharacterized protein n=1 Tax=Lactuca virosa TaxID=75947 RepID=A0AAU9LVZ2_9ASTR|nr:unnamed protein product [Lactuca virosa]
MCGPYRGIPSRLDRRRDNRIDDIQTPTPNQSPATTCRFRRALSFNLITYRTRRFRLVVLLMRSDVKQSASIFKRNVRQIRHWLEEESASAAKEIEKAKPKELPKKDIPKDD